MAKTDLTAVVKVDPQNREARQELAAVQVGDYTGLLY